VWPDEFVKQIAQNVALAHFLSKLIHNFYRGNEWPKHWPTFASFIKRPKEKKSPKRRKFAQKAKIRPIWSPCSLRSFDRFVWFFRFGLNCCNYKRWFRHSRKNVTLQNINCLAVAFYIKKLYKNTNSQNFQVYTTGLLRYISEPDLNQWPSVREADAMPLSLNTGCIKHFYWE
jgi:hypothetical protein